MSLTPAVALTELQNWKVSFLGIAGGEAVIIPGWVPGDIPPQEFNIGRGIMSVKGSTVAVGPIPPNDNIDWTFYFAQTGVKAEAIVSASWSGHRLLAYLYSDDLTGGVFVSESDYGALFLVGATPDLERMSFRGVLRDSSGNHLISGKAGVLAFPLGETGVLGMGVMFLGQDGTTPLLTVMWAKTTTQLDSSTILHAARPFIHNVKTTLLP